MQRYRKLIVFIFLSIVIGFIEFYFRTNSLFFILFIVISVFYYLDSMGNKSTDKSLKKEFYDKKYEFNRFDYYVLDETRSFGLFIKIFNQPIFIDLREDSLLENRKRQALYLLENVDLLEYNLNLFLKENPIYRGKELEVIGLYYDDVTSGDVFWGTAACTSIKDLIFTLY